MQGLNRPPQEYIAANAEKIRELGLKTPTLRFWNVDVQNLKFSVMDRLHKPPVAACKVVAAGNRIVLQPESQGGFSSKMWARSAGNDSSSETESTCSRVGSSSKLHKSGWRLWTECAQTTGRVTRKSSHQCGNKDGCERRGEKWSCECRRVCSDEF